MYAATAIMTLALVGISVYCIFISLHKLRRQRYMDEIDLQFRRCWNCKEDEKLHAWYRVRLELLARDSEDKHLRYVDRQIKELDKQAMLSGYGVDENGNIETGHASESCQVR